MKYTLLKELEKRTNEFNRHDNNSYIRCIKIEDRDLGELLYFFARKEEKVDIDVVASINGGAKEIASCKMIVNVFHGNDVVSNNMTIENFEISPEGKIISIQEDYKNIISYMADINNIKNIKDNSNYFGVIEIDKQAPSKLPTPISNEILDDCRRRNYKEYFWE